jgi:hypothetical protein
MPSFIRLVCSSNTALIGDAISAHHERHNLNRLLIASIPIFSWLFPPFLLTVNQCVTCVAPPLLH